jgi:hypothetical protein
MFQLAAQNHALPTAAIQLFMAQISAYLAPVLSCGCQINRILQQKIMKQFRGTYASV